MKKETTCIYEMWCMRGAQNTKNHFSCRSLVYAKQSTNQARDKPAENSQQPSEATCSQSGFNHQSVVGMSLHIRDFITLSGQLRIQIAERIMLHRY